MAAAAVRAVLLDLDETLTARAPTLRAYAQRFVERFGPDLKTDRLDAVHAEIAAVDDNGYNHHRAEDLARSPLWRTSPGAEVLEQHWDATFPAVTAAREGLHATLDGLAARGLSLGVVTNGYSERQRRKLDVLGIRGRLGAVVASFDLDIHKPDARIFHAAAEQLGVPPSQCVYVGDNPAKDVQGALDAGLHAVWFRARLPWPSELRPPPASVSALCELLDLPLLSR